MRTSLIALAILLACSKPEAKTTNSSPPAEVVKAKDAPPVEAGEKDKDKDQGKGAGKSRAEGQGYLVEVVPPAEAGVGKAGVAKIVLKGTQGYHINMEFPTSLEVVPPPGVDVAKAKQTRADAAKFEEAEAIFEVGFTAKEAGAKQFAATFKFAVCTETTCDPKREKLAWNVDVK